MSPPASQFLRDLTGEFIDNGGLKLLCLLGSGAFGKVYQALDTTAPPDELVYYAVKCMPRYEPGSREENLQQDEITTHLMLSDHPRVITLYRYFTTDEFVFMVLDLSTGGDMFRALVPRELYRANPALIKTAFGELLDAVEFCHRNGVFHRDLKPENILCNSEGSDLRLADFGLAAQRVVSSQFGCGTRGYMSPESIYPTYVDDCYSAHHSDLWALSVIFTTMISGHHPWHSADMFDAGFVAF
ncbi:kinase-like domain-containing protein, partial [Mycena rosella]